MEKSFVVSLKHCLLAATMATSAAAALANPPAPGQEPPCPMAGAPGMPAKPGSSMPGPGMPGPGVGGPMEALPPFLHGVELSEAQRDKLFELSHAQVPVIRAKMKTLQKAESELHGLALSADYSEAKLKSLVDTISRTQGELMFARIKSERQAYEVLTPEQRKKLAERPQPPQGPQDHGEPMRGKPGEGKMPPKP